MIAPPPPKKGVGQGRWVNNEGLEGGRN